MNNYELSDILNRVIHGNCLDELKKIPDNVIDCCITSPPYWGLRDYGHQDQLGKEENFEKFIQNLCAVFSEVKRVLKPTGTCFVNIGDTYAGSGAGTTQKADISGYIKNSKQVYVLPNGTAKSSALRSTKMNKSLCMIPERFAIAMIDMGWCLRNQIIWHKPNQMPASVKDRFTVDFEKVFFFVKQPKEYYFKQQIEPYSTKINRWGGTKLVQNGGSEWDKGTGQKIYRSRDMRPNKEGRNMRTVWSINTKPSKNGHFATYPEKLVERMLVAGCPENGIVLDPFFGTGTTGLCAKKNGRNFVGIEISGEYVNISKNLMDAEASKVTNLFNTDTVITEQLCLS
jgi:DNA modification methylase